MSHLDTKFSPLQPATTQTTLKNFPTISAAFFVCISFRNYSTAASLAIFHQWILIKITPSHAELQTLLPDIIVNYLLILSTQTVKPQSYAYIPPSKNEQCLGGRRRKTSRHSEWKKTRSNLNRN